MAIAPERMGIGIQRRFTTPGQHPYDSVIWERRDARIVNFATGAVAFEQLGVEVPSTWSLNATNILAQKYFRGTLGTPEREWSLKQVVDRVVDTITAWGRKDGYFVDDAEAETFSDELKYLIIHQKAAFNSPVWFNIGVIGVPQQGSACFILAVKDSMDSILNWYTEEGTIFKGGSGAGVNLSKIRSSKEGLRGGGTASGPVSFMRGADASAGTIKSGGKCFKEGTFVATPTGWRTIEQLRIGDVVLTHKGPQKVADFMPNGVKQCFKVVTREGYEVEVTSGHKFAYWDAEEGAFDVKPIEQFQPGDALYVLVEPSLGGAKIPLLPPQIVDSPKATTTVEMNFPTELDDRLSYVLGLSYGDGELRTAYPYRLRVAFCKDDPGLVSAERFSTYCEELFGDRPLNLGDYDGHFQLGLTRKRLIDFLVVNGIAKGKGGALGFPAMLFQAEPEVRAAFVAGIIDADGTYQRRGGWSVSSIDKDFLVELQRLLLTLGVPSKLKISREARNGWKTLYRLTIVGHTFIDRLVRHIGPYSAKAQLTYIPSDGADKGWGYRPSLYRNLDRRVLRRGGHRLVDRTLGSDNETSGYGAVATLTRHPDEAVASYAAELSTCVQVTLHSVTASEIAPTYDIEVQGTHLLSANGIYASNTRRAAKMVILNADHPDIEDFIWCKAIEERKARALRDAGFDMDLDGKDSYSIQYQNANNSVRVTDEFMQAVLDDADWHLRAISDGEILETIKARDLFRQIAKAAWECADPGMQFDTTINRWHTAPNTDRINASNPCFTGDVLVHTDKGLISFKELFDRTNHGESFAVYTHDATSLAAPSDSVELTRPEAFMITGFNEVVRLRFDNGMEVRCTPGHKFFTVNRGYVAAIDLTAEDKVKVLDLPAPPVSAEWRLPIPTELDAYRRKGDHLRTINLPEKWTTELAHYLGWLVGDGSLASNGTISAIYGTPEEQEEILPRHSRFVSELNGGSTPKPSVQANGTVQQRLTRRAITAFFGALGYDSKTAVGKHVPDSIFQAPEPVVAAFLQGLFDSDGCVRRDEKKGSYVGLGSSSRDLLIGVQRLLTTYGISSTMYKGRDRGSSSFRYTRKDGSEVQYLSGSMFDLRITATSIPRFENAIGFSLSSKAATLRSVVSERVRGFYRTDTTARLAERVEDGYELTYNLTEPKNHSYVANGLIVRNCSEYMHLDNSACNLASLNLMTFLQDDGTFDVEGFKAATEVVFTGQEIIVGNADYPTEKIAENSRRFRQLGIGYANLGALLMAQGLPYDSDAGRAWAGAITALLTGHSYTTSARTAARMGPFAGYQDNREPMLDVLRMHRDAAAQIDEELVPPELLSAAQESWDSAVEIAEQYGVRNAQSSVLAPTGTIGLLMDCDTTGIEPDLGLVKMKKLVGGGTMSIVNQTVPRALRQLGYSQEQMEEVVAYIDEHKSIFGAPHLQADHLPVFACSMGDNTIHYRGHIQMMGAVQPFISGAISKTVNVPEDVTVEDVEQLHIEAWQLGLKAIAIYRDNCKVAQPLATAKKTVADPSASAAEVHDAELALKVAELENALQRQTTVVVKQPIRERLPRRRASSTFAFRVADCEGYVTVGEYEDGRPGEVFMKVSKQGSTLSGIMDAFSIAISLGLQHGVPLATFVKKYTNMRFEPAGMTDDPDLRIAQSLMDYIFRRLAVDYLPFNERAELGVLTTAERTQQTLPGIEETVTPNLGLDAGPQMIEASPAASTLPASTVKPAAESDAPYCFQCGVQMQRAGSCHACPSCGTTSGCS